MGILAPERRGHVAAATGLLGAALLLTGCGEQRGTDAAVSAPSAAARSTGPDVTGPNATGPSTTAPSTARSVAPSAAANESESAGASETAASPLGPPAYVEPGIVDGAPHNGANNDYRRPGEMSAANEAAAQREAARIEPVLRQLWTARTWDPRTVREALLRLGYEEERTGPTGEPLGGTLSVQPMAPRHEVDHYVTPEGARIALRVGGDACVTAWVQQANFTVKVNGRFAETGCFEPAVGH
ncbi:hypothetical protein [Streptodolium elevatio]